MKEAVPAWSASNSGTIPLKLEQVTRLLSISDRYSAYAPEVTHSRAKSIKGTLSEQNRGGLRVDEHLIATLKQYEQASPPWAGCATTYKTSAEG